MGTREDLVRAVLGSEGTGDLGTYIPHAEVLAPTGPVNLGPGGAHWQVELDPGKLKTKAATRGMLDTFVALWRQPDAEIVRFIERWGPLSVAPDGTRLNGVLDRDAEPMILRGVDSIAAWRFFSRRAESVLKIAAKAKSGRRAGDADWDGISTPQASGPAGPITSVGDTGAPAGSYGLPNWTRRELVCGPNGPEWGELLGPERAKDIVAGEINTWIDRFKPSFRLEVAERSGWQIQISFRRWLLSAIALQLALAVMRIDSLFICSGCDRLYGRTGKRPNSSENNYCPKCGQGKARENAERNRQIRRAEAKRLYAEGKTVAEIAALLKARGGVASVRRWIQKGK